MSANIKEFSTYTLTSPLIKIGEFTDSKGETLKITPEVAKDIYESLQSAAPFKDIHGDGQIVGSIQKYILNSDGIYQKTLITDPERFLQRYNDGHVYISPEISLETDHKGKVRAILDGAAMTNNPGMVNDMPKLEKFHFEAQPSPEPTPVSSEGKGWQEPLGELKSTINTLNDTLSTFGEQVKNMNSTSTTTQTPPAEPQTSPNTLNISVDDLAKLVNDAVEKRLSAAQPSVPEASETPAEQPKSTTTSDDDSDVAKKYADMMSKVQKMEEAQEKVYKKQLGGIMGELKGMGMEHPEKMIPDGLTTEQQITILESIKENFAKNSPMSAPLQEPLSGQNLTQQTKTDTIDDILASEEFQASNNPTLRNMFLDLANPDVMRKYNMNPLFNQNGEWIGPKL